MLCGWWGTISFSPEGRLALDINSTTLQGVLRSIQPSRPHSVHAPRRDARSALIGQATIIPITKRLPESPISVLVRDISPSGVCIILTQIFHVADRFLLLLAHTAGPQRAVLSEVKHWRSLSNDLFAIGAEFVRMVEGAQAASELAREDSPSPTAHVAAPVAIPMEETIGQFRESAWRGMPPADVAQLQELEARLATLLNE